MQIIYITNRPSIFNATLEQVALFMPFIKEALVLSPRAMHHQLRSPGDIKLSLLADEDLDEVFTEERQRGDHVFRNYFLRKAVLARPEVGEEFILSDDDYRPIRPIEVTFFKKEGKYRCFYFYDLESWPANATAFDRGMHSTAVLLRYFQLPTLGFASHMPQMMNKALFAEAADFFAPHSSKYQICEWTSYFNYNCSKHPERFHEPEVYQTMCWPELPLIWPWFVKPAVYSFENYCPDLYEKGSILEGVKRCPGALEYEAINLEKLQKTYEIEVGRRILPYHPKDPLRRGWLRSIVAKLTWWISVFFRRIK